MRLTPLGKTLFAVTTVLGFTFAGSTAKAEGWGTIRGKLVWTGSSIPEQPKLTITKDEPVCIAGREQAGLGPIVDETMVVNPQTKAISNVFVYLNSRQVPPIHPDYPQDKDAVGEADLKAYEAAYGFAPDDIGKAVATKKLTIEDLAKMKENSHIALIDQVYCQYVPHAIAIREGQKVLAVNAETIAHNVKVNSFFGNESNLNMPSGTFLFYDWTAENTPLGIECNIHGWMKMYAMVFKHPYFDVTGADGGFELKNVPAGEIELVFRNPKYILGGRNKYTLTVAADEVVELEVSYDGTVGKAEKK